MNIVIASESESVNNPPIMERRILHVDMDAFYASVEVLDNPDLAGKALIVGGLGPRSVVCACSYEARKFGVHSAMPMRTARDRCPRAIVVKPRMERYEEISARIFEYLRDVVPLVEAMSIDEGYLDISEVAADDSAALALGQRIKEDIRSYFGLACSIGIAPCKFLSKIASDLRKPDALVLVPTAEVEEFLAPLPVDKIPGVGSVGLKKLHKAGAQSIGELRGLPRDGLRGMFGKWGDRLYDFARGIDPRLVIVEHERKSVGTEQTFDTDQMQLEPLCRTLQKQAREVERMLRESAQMALTVTVKVRYSNFQRITRQRTFSAPVQSAGEIAAIACDLLKLTEAGQRPVRLIGISVSAFVPQDGWEEMPLFGHASG